MRKRQRKKNEPINDILNKIKELYPRVWRISSAQEKLNKKVIDINKKNAEIMEGLDWENYAGWVGDEN